MLLVGTSDRDFTRAPLFTPFNISGLYTEN